MSTIPRLLLTAGLAGLILAPLAPAPARAGDDEPVCIKTIDGVVTMLPGECPGFGPWPGAMPGQGTPSRAPARSADRAARGAAPEARGAGPAARATTGDTAAGSAGLRTGSERVPDGSPAPSSASSLASSGAAGRATSGSSAAGSHASSETMLARVDGIRATKDEARAMEAFEDLVAMGEPAVAPLIRVYQDAKADPRTRWVAGRALGRLAYAASTDALIAGLRDPQPMARVAAARALQDQGQRRAVPALVKALDDPGAIVRAAVIDALGTLGSSREAKAVAAQLTDSKNFIRQQGLFVRTHAAAALGRLGGPDAIEALIEVVEDRDKETRAAAQASLFTLSGRSTTPSGAGGEKARWQAWWKESR